MIVEDGPENIGSRWADRYVVLSEIGRGGMSTVYKALDLRYGGDVAVKVLRREVATVALSKRLAREIRILSRLEHPNILPVLDSGEFDGLPFFVMPLVSGENLQERLRRERRLPVLEAVRVASEVATSLSYAHEMGVVHRDVKPSNILLSSNHVLVTDFGIARQVDGQTTDQLTKSGEAIGTVVYMSPEQTAASTVDGRSDTYSLGCVLYEMLAGSPPFVGSTSLEVMERHRHAPIPAVRERGVSIPEALERAILRALAKGPADRFPDTQDFRVAIERACS